MTDFIATTNPKVNDALYYIPALFCAACDDWRNFYLHEGKPYCDCCHDGLTATKEDIERVADRSPRDPILRFKSKIGSGQLTKI